MLLTRFLLAAAVIPFICGPATAFALTPKDKDKAAAENKADQDATSDESKPDSAKKTDDEQAAQKKREEERKQREQKKKREAERKKREAEAAKKKDEAEKKESGSKKEDAKEPKADSDSKPKKKDDEGKPAESKDEPKGEPELENPKNEKPAESKPSEDAAVSASDVKPEEPSKPADGAAPPAPPRAKPEVRPLPSLGPPLQADDGPPAPPKPEGKQPEAPAKPEPKPEPAPKPKKPSAASDLSQVDEDYWFQGEFISDGFFSEQLSGLTGLQVIAMGDGKFEGVVYAGGLPGAGWNHMDKQHFAGARQDGAVNLSGDHGSLLVYTDSATLLDTAGQPVEQLRRVRRISPTMGQRPTSNAIVVFDGVSTEFLEGAKLSDEGLLLAGTTMKFPVGDFRLHLEFRTPYMPHARGQARGNSGVYIQRRYEVQVLDSFGLEGVENECGGLYKQRRPHVNMCLPPLVWQTYDIGFAAARYDADGNKIANARITVLHNGQPIHENYEIVAKTGAGKPETPELLPIYLQDHGNPVTFRNIWLEPKDPYQYIGSSAAHCQTP